MSMTVRQGRFLNSSEVATSRKVAVIGPEVVEKLYGAKVALGKEIIISDTRFKVIGVLDNLGAGMIGGQIDKSVYIPITSAQALFGVENVQSIMIKFSGSERLDESKYKVKSFLLRSLKEDDFSLISQGSLLSTITSIMSVLTVALGGIAAISLLVGGIGIMNIMLVSVTERTREIGIRKSVGAQNSDVLTQFLVEAVFLSIIGGLMGSFLGVLAAIAVGMLISANAFSWWSVLLALGVSSLVGIVFGVAPAAKAARLDPVESLRYE
jgi:putative ABC transport system permease protein